MRPALIKLVPAAVALAAAVTVAACGPGRDKVTMEGDELSSAFSEFAESVPPKSFESALPPVDLPQTPDASASSDYR